jgi:hypothetical protein
MVLVDELIKNYEKCLFVKILLKNEMLVARGGCFFFRHFKVFGREIA